MLRQYAFNLILLFILPLWVISCQKTPDFVVQTLSSAENCMEAHPDSDDQWVAKGKSFFYYGRVMKELNRPEDAMRYYLKAKSIFDGSKEYRMLGLISEEIGTLNWSQYLTDEALLNYQDALRYYTMINDVLGMSYSSRNIARYYLSCDNKIDSAYVYYDNNCNSELTILQELGVLYRLKKDYKKSEYYLLKALELAKEDSLSSGIYLSLGYTYLLMGNMTVAEDYLDKSTRGVNIYTQADAYKLLFKLEKQKNAPWVALEYKERSDSIFKIIQKKEIKEAVADLQKKYENEKLQKENLQLKIKNQSILLLCFVLLFLILLCLLYVYYRHQHNKKRIQEIEQQINFNKEEIALYQEELVNYQLLQSESEDYRSKIGELNGKVLLLQSQNRTLVERLNSLGGDIGSSCSPVDGKYISIFRMLLSLKSGSFKGKLSHSDWDHLFDLFNFLYLGIVIRLQEEYPQLTKHDLEIFCLLKFGFTNDALKKVFLTTSDSITKAKGRLKKRLNVAPQEDLDHFIRNY